MKNSHKILTLIAVSVLFAPIVGGFALSIGMVVGASILFSVVPKVSTAFDIAIPTTDVSNMFTKAVLARVMEDIKPTKFFTSMFTRRFEPVFAFSFFVNRGNESVAVDVHEFSEGNFHKTTKSTEKILRGVPYKDVVNYNDTELYFNVVSGVARGDMNGLTPFVTKKAQETLELMYKQDRAIELQCAQLLEDGIVRFSNNTNIDFKRKAASLVDNVAAGGTYWDNTTTVQDIFKDFQKACRFIRTNGKITTSTFDAILGEDAMAALEQHPLFLERQKLFNMKLDEVTQPLAQAEGSTLHGFISAGSYKVRLWTYPQFYDTIDANGNITASTPYKNPKTVVVLPAVDPSQLGFEIVSTLVHQVIVNGGIEQTGEMLVRNFVNREKGYDRVVVERATIAIAKYIDRMYTMKVLA